MKKKRIFVLFICIALLLSSCSPALVGEAKAKEIGLAVIQQAFEVDLTDAVVTVEYRERPGETYQQGESIQYGMEEPIRFYEIKVNPDEIGNADYYAEVNAVNGLAYRADKSIALIPRTEEQLAEAAALKPGDDLPVENYEVDETGSLQQAEDWVRAHFEPDTPVLRTVPNSSMTDSVDFPLFTVSCFVVFVDGTIYSVDVCWPTMDVTSVYLCNQEY